MPSPDGNTFRKSAVPNLHWTNPAMEMLYNGASMSISTDEGGDDAGLRSLL